MTFVPFLLVTLSKVPNILFLYFVVNSAKIDVKASLSAVFKFSVDNKKIH